MKSTNNTKKGLQKLTESENKLNAILALQKVTPEDVKDLSQEERNKLGAILTHQLNTLEADEKEKLYDKVEEIMDSQTKNEIWEHNHINIMWGISVLIKENGRMPTKTEIAGKTKISRQTIYKHLKNYKNNPFNAEFQEQFAIMYPKLMASVFQYALKGDMRAAKLYLESIGALKTPSSGSNGNTNTLIQNQNNYIQINGKVLSQETVKNLNPEQLNTIEGILKTIEIKETD
ncbi:hypothetical protein [Chryseobacterium sp. SIMBA_029]|uniref:hypothetical protein n=1 Tax=Chryseobacterium sp. SIMBA_029 TaxID=3085772 RepID=UPI00397A5A3F